MDDELLAHIGLTSAPAADADGLRQVHRAYLQRVPYDNLTIQLGEAGPLDIAAVRRRVLDGRRGGYCFEVNGLLAELLEGIGFRVERREGIVGPREDDAQTNHLALIVEASGERFVADAGWGEGFLEPIALRPGRHEQGPFHWSVEAGSDGGWWVGQHEWGDTPGFRIGAERVTMAAFDAPHARLSQDPESPFVRVLVAQMPGGERITTLRARTLSVAGPGVDESQLVDEAGFARALSDVFGVRTDVLGPERLALLWRRVCGQHDAWAAAQSSPD